jgi:hypothetical protein
MNRSRGGCRVFLNCFHLERLKECLHVIIANASSVLKRDPQITACTRASLNINCIRAPLLSATKGRWKGYIARVWDTPFFPVNNNNYVKVYSAIEFWKQEYWIDRGLESLYFSFRFRKRKNHFFRFGSGFRSTYVCSKDIGVIGFQFRFGPLESIT